METNWNELPVVLTVAEAARILRRGRACVYALCHTRDFPAIKVGRVIRIPREALRTWLEKHSDSSSVPDGHSLSHRHGRENSAWVNPVRRNGR
ncbi:MAG: helix-turn-helix domain-containing protein [Ignavibacteriales bacterium]